MHNTFSYQNINTGRQVEIDIIKAVSVVVFMILCHVYEYDTEGYTSTFSWVSDELLGGLAAPVFMFAMGFGMKYSRNHSLKSQYWRGGEASHVRSAVEHIPLCYPQSVALGDYW